MNRKEQKEQRRQEILFAALDLFVTKGYQATRISDIAEKVGMSTGLLFHYFESKEVLYKELVTIGLEGTKAPASKEYEHAIDYFTCFVQELFGLMKTNVYVSQLFVLMAEAQKSDAAPESVRMIANSVNTINDFVPIVKRGQKEGSIRKGDALAISTSFFCSIQGIAEYYGRRRDFELPDPEWIVDIVRKS